MSEQKDLAMSDQKDQDEKIRQYMTILKGLLACREVEGAVLSMETEAELAGILAIIWIGLSGASMDLLEGEHGLIEMAKRNKVARHRQL